MQNLIYPKSDIQRLRALEQTIAEGGDTFIRVGLALQQIKESKLYLIDAPSWTAYCEKKCESQWGFTTPQNANRLIQNADIASMLGITPTRESHIKPLSILNEDELKKEAWRTAIKENQKVTQKVVEKVSKRIFLRELGDPWAKALVLINEFRLYSIYNSWKKENGIIKNIIIKWGLKNNGFDVKIVPLLHRLATDELNDLFLSGHLNNIHFSNLSYGDVERYINRLYYEKMQLIREQKEEQLKDKVIVTDSNTLTDDLQKNPMMVFAFPEQKNPTQFITELKNNGYEVLFIAVYDKNNQPRMKTTKGFLYPHQINGIKPIFMDNLIKQSTLSIKN